MPQLFPPEIIENSVECYHDTQPPSWCQPSKHRLIRAH